MTSTAPRRGLPLVSGKDIPQSIHEALAEVTNETKQATTIPLTNSQGNFTREGETTTLAGDESSVKAEDGTVAPPSTPAATNVGVRFNPKPRQGPPLSAARQHRYGRISKKKKRAMDRKARSNVDEQERVDKQKHSSNPTQPLNTPLPPDSDLETVINAALSTASKQSGVPVRKLRKRLEKERVRQKKDSILELMTDQGKGLPQFIRNNAKKP